MCLNKMSRTSSRNIGPQHQTTAVYYIVHMGYFLSLCSPNPSSVFAATNIFLVSSDHRSQSHLTFQLCLTTEYAGVCFWTSKDNFSWNPPKQHVVMYVLFGNFLKVFLAQRHNYFLQFSSCGSWRVFRLSNSPSHRALGQYRDTSSSRQFRWLEILNYCPDGVNGNFHFHLTFLKSKSLICETQLSFAAHQKYTLWFYTLWWMIKGIWSLFSLLFIFLWNRKPWLDHFMFINHPGVLKNGNILQKYFTH